MIKKYVLSLFLCLGVSSMPVNANANFGKKLNAIKDAADPTVNKLSKIYDLIDATYQNLDDSEMTAEEIGLQLSTKASKAAAVAREVAETDKSKETVEALERVTEHTEFIRCYALNNAEYLDLMNALNNNDTAGIKAMLGKTVMCRKIDGIARVVGVNGTTLKLENIVGKTPASYEWGKGAEGKYIIFDKDNKTPVNL